MATDYSILEAELTDLKTNLKRDLHMYQVRRLRKKQHELAMNVVQRKQIENLTKQLADIEPVVSTMYCPQFALKDNEITGYLVYLLKMKDFFSREVATKQEMINLRDSEIKILQRKLCVVVNEQAKIKKSMPVKSPEYIRLENMSGRLNQMNKRICTMKQENKEMVENITSMGKFQRQFKIFEKDFRSKIKSLREKSHELLGKAVAAYDEKEEFMNKGKVLEERAVEDSRKTAINENALNLCLQRAEKNEAFARIQSIIRTDARIAETSDMMEKGITGLEPSLERMQNLHADISEAAGDDSPEIMEENFRRADHETDMMFSYLDEIIRDIHNSQENIKKLKEENRLLIKKMSRTDRRLRKDIKTNQDEAKKKSEEADKASSATDDAKGMMDSIFETVQFLYRECCPEDETPLEQKPVDESNVIEYLLNMEKQLLDYLICLEYLRMKEASKEDKPIVLEGEEDADVDDQVETVDVSDTYQPRTLSSEYDLESLLELDFETNFLEFKNLKSKAVDALSEIMSENSGEEDDDDN